MARHIGPVCKLCRREGLKLFLKGDRCFTLKCAIEKRNYPPGAHGQRRSKHSEYGLQLREKQKMKRLYGILETQFRSYFRMAERQKGITGENLVRLLEQRLDNVVHRLGLGASRAQARMLIVHGHIRVNGRRVTIPSYLLRAGDVVEVQPASREIEGIKAALEGAKKRRVPSWLELDAANFKGTVRSLPSKEEMAIPVQEQLVVALYSK
ncbi:MAG: 30S ribosomal protein S4 [candidate division NC10 bacterium RIFCSPLOWO2_12_FULL_66_18]|nr:MAG: 30S ribosomal protein S4 [candidate division NC10 bacterium RIFCSPLOWO2_02_FULL_66_22]OGB96608.1 MAG: 30S ribosomal protein S4 [candidate division NC10 bacterium RIFCSPLOWO2_12_FULL_66_18]